MLALASVNKSSWERDLPLGPSWKGFRRVGLKLVRLILLHILEGRVDCSVDCLGLPETGVAPPMSQETILALETEKWGKQGPVILVGLAVLPASPGGSQGR